VSRIYDRIGRGYARTRRPDPRIAAAIGRALEGCASLVNVGAGAGSYEPADRRVVAVEPSATMIRQRPAGAAEVVRGVAERLPLADAAVDGALAVLTAHHWRDLRRGLAEMRRVARRRVVVLTWDQPVFEDFWLVREYLPGILEVDRPRALAIAEVAAALEASEVLTLPIPHDCADGFLGAFWRRPEAYLDPGVRAGMSVCSAMAAAGHGPGEWHLERAPPRTARARGARPGLPADRRLGTAGARVLPRRPTLTAWTTAARPRAPSWRRCARARPACSRSCWP
jgi:SAM-dependent methyltransferase